MRSDVRWQNVSTPWINGSSELTSGSSEWTNGSSGGRTVRNERFTKVDERFTKVDERLTKVDERHEGRGALTTVDERLTTVDERLTNVDGQLTTFDGRFKSIDQQLVEMKAHLEIRIEAVDTKVVQVYDAVIAMREDAERNVIEHKSSRVDARASGGRQDLVLLDLLKTLDGGEATMDREPLVGGAEVPPGRTCRSWCVSSASDGPRSHLRACGCEHDTGRSDKRPCRAIPGRRQSGS